MASTMFISSACIALYVGVALLCLAVVFYPDLMRAYKHYRQTTIHRQKTTADTTYFTKHPVDNHEQEPVPRPRPSLQAGLLSRQEENVLALVCAGHTNREIAKLLSEGMTSEAIAHRLSISAHTVKTHRAHLYEKLKIESNASFYALASSTASQVP